MTKKQPLFDYILMSLKGAFEIILMRFENAVGYFDLSANGYWRSFLAIIVPIPILIMTVIMSGKGFSSSLNIAQLIIYFTDIPLFAFVMIYFTKWMKIDKNYASMIIMYNWLWALKYLIVAVLQMVMLFIFPDGGGTGVTLALGLYLGGYISWYLYKNSLAISGGFAFGVLVFALVFSLAYGAVIMNAIAADEVAELRRAVGGQLKKESIPEAQSDSLSEFDLIID